MNKKTFSPLATAVGAAFLASASLAPATFATENPFAAEQLTTGYNLAHKDAEGKCGDKSTEAKCGADKKSHAEGACGGDKHAEGACGTHAEKKPAAEGKCGEGKCGEDKSDE